MTPSGIFLVRMAPSSWTLLGWTGSIGEIANAQSVNLPSLLVLPVPDKNGQYECRHYYPSLRINMSPTSPVYN